MKIHKLKYGYEAWGNPKWGYIVDFEDDGIRVEIGGAKTLSRAYDLMLNHIYGE
jgi:hypothetical protein